MFCGLCSMSPQPTAASPSQAPSGPDLGHKLKAALQQGVRRPAPLLPAGSFAGFQGWASKLEGLVPAPPSRGEKDSVWAGKRVPCGSGSGTKTSCHTALGVQIQQGPETSHKAAADRCAGCSPGTAQAVELCPILLWAPGLGSWGLDLPHSIWTFLHASLQPCSLNLLS